MGFILVGGQSVAGGAERWALSPQDLSELERPEATVGAWAAESGTPAEPRRRTLRSRIFGLMEAFQDVNAGFFV